jgi:hypothetical protein
MIYIYSHMSSEIIQSVAFDSYDDFQHVKTSYFHSKNFTIFRDYLRYFVST